MHGVIQNVQPDNQRCTCDKRNTKLVMWVESMAYVYSANVLYEDELFHQPYIRHALAYQGGCVCGAGVEFVTLIAT